MRTKIFFLVIAALPIINITHAQNSVTTQLNDINRTGWNNGEYILTQSNVRPGSLGKLFTRYIDDYVNAQPLVMLKVDMPGVGIRNVVYVATESNTIYAY